MFRGLSAERGDEGEVFGKLEHPNPTQGSGLVDAKVGLNLRDTTGREREVELLEPAEEVGAVYRESCDTISTTDCAARHLPVSLCLCADITASSELTPWMSELCDNLRGGLVDEGSHEDTVRSASGFLTESFNLISHGWSEGLRRRVMQHCESSSTNGSSSGRHATIPRGVVGH